MKNIKINDYEVCLTEVMTSKVVNENVVLLFLHEALGSIGQWKDFPQELCQEIGLKGIVYERRGHGNSSELGGKRTIGYLEEYAFNELSNLIDKIFSPDKKIILVGHSDGASIALLYASRFNKNILGVVSMAAHVIVEDETLAGIHPAIQAFEQGKLEGLKKYHGTKTSELFYAWANTWLHPSFKEWDITPTLSGIKTPVLALQGVNDQYGTELQLDLIVKHTTGPVTKQFIPKCGHHPHLEQRKEVINFISDWSSKLH